MISLPGQDKAINIEHSTISVHVGNAGLFSVAGHEHWVNAPISSGLVNDSDLHHVEFRVAASRMEVKPDPEIRRQNAGFRSSRVEKHADGQWKLEGMLTMHEHYEASRRRGEAQ